MDDGYWGPFSPLSPSSPTSKRFRTDPDFTLEASGMERHNYFSREEDGAGPLLAVDPTSIGALYDRYLQNQKSVSGSGTAGNINGSGLSRGVSRGSSPDDNAPYTSFDPKTLGLKDFAVGRFVNQFPMVSALQPPLPDLALSLPSIATQSLFVEGLPLNCTEREVAHIFRPFLGYKETRLVIKEPKHLILNVKQPDGHQKVICFVDFTNAASAMTAIIALQGYKMDERNPDSAVLKLQFSRSPLYGPGSRSNR